MKIRYDENVDAIYIRFKEAGYSESNEIKEGFIVDYDKSGNIVAIEILDASNYILSNDLTSIQFEVNRAASNKKAI